MQDQPTFAAGSAPITISDRAAERNFSRRHVEKGIRRDDIADCGGVRIGANYFDLAVVMDYWSEKGPNHHTEATSMLYGARECARVALGEGLEARFARHAAAGRAVVAGARAMGLTVFGDDAYRMTNVTDIEAQGADHARGAGDGPAGREVRGTRDLIGYGQHPPDSHWPDGARVAVNFVVNYEEGAENSVLSIDETDPDAFIRLFAAMARCSSAAGAAASVMCRPSS